MEMTTLGRDGPPVSAMGLGTAAVGRPGYLNVDHGTDMGGDHAVATMRRRAHEVFDAAFGAGVRYFDTARSYGRAEAFLASWLADRHIGFDDVTIGSKWGYRYTADWRVDAPTHEVKDHSRRQLDHQWEESRGVLGDRLDLYQVHSVTPDSGVLTDRTVLDRLAELREGGVAIGVTVSGEEQRDLVYRAMEVEYDGSCLFTSVQATWNLLEPSAGAALADAGHEGLGVIVKEAVANGRLTDRGERHLHRERWEALTALADELGTGPDGVALAAAVSRPWASVVLSGASTPEQVEANTDALGVAWTEGFDRRLRGFAEDATQYWTYRSNLPWS
jgi:aryl-alcohol dehydrogenase-like predicted oxidoreductase